MRLVSLGSSIALTLVALGNVGQANAAVAGKNPNIIELSTSSDMSEAQSVNSAIDALVDAAATCRKTTSLTPVQCECRSRTGLASLKSAYVNAVSGHPAWATPGRTVLWIDPTSKHSIAVNFSAVSRLLDTCGMK